MPVLFILHVSLRVNSCLWLKIKMIKSYAALQCLNAIKTTKHSLTKKCISVTFPTRCVKQGLIHVICKCKYILFAVFAQ